MTHNEAKHFWHAFVLVGMLIARGRINVDFEAHNWEHGFKVMVYQVAGVLNALEPD